MIIFPYMLRPAEQLHVTEYYVSSPPALTIFDESGDCWTLANELGRKGPEGEFAFMVLRNGMPTGTVASRIERRSGRVRAFTQDGWKRWTGNVFI